MLQARPPHRAPGMAIFLTSDPDVAPVALMHNLKHNKVLHEKNVILTVRTSERPRVKEADRVRMEPINDDFKKVTVTYGFMETPNVPRALGLCRKKGLKFDIMSTSFFLGRRSLIPSARQGMPLWQDRLFIFLMRNAANPTDFFHIPPGRVVEFGRAGGRMRPGARPGQSSEARGRRMATKGKPRPVPTADAAAPSQDDIGVEARVVAGLLLNAALEKRNGLDEALSQPPARVLAPVDRAFARAVAMAALRRLGEIDQILDRRLQKSPPEAVRTLMRIALAQTLVLETPAFAAVSTAVKLAERDPKTRPYKNLVNAVLRGVGRDGPGPDDRREQSARLDRGALEGGLWRGGAGRAGAGRSRGACDRPQPEARRRSRRCRRRRRGRSLVPGARFAPAVAATWRPGPASRTATGGSRTPPPPCPVVC